MLNFRDPGLMSARAFYSDYEMPLAHAFYNINKRGLLVDATELASLRSYVIDELNKSCRTIETQLGVKVVPQAPDSKWKCPAGTINLSSGDQLKKMVKSLGIKVPIKRGRGTETLDEEAINDLYAETGSPFLKELLRVRELNKMLGTYIDCELEQNILYSAYFVTGTVTGRRSSRENFLGLGTNGQNWPKHSDLGKRYRKCIISRPGKIFVACDQVQAEDWVVNAIIADIGGDRAGLNEQLAGIDRHSKLASFIFSKPIDQCGKDTPERFMGKKTRHAGNYDVEGFQLSAAFSKEGFLVPPKTCYWLLERFHAASPGIKKVFHQYVQDQLTSSRTLITPFGRLRQFLSLRDYANNKKIFKEAYAQIPQSTVGDNTGIAVLWLETNHPGYVVQDGHDSVTLEVPDTCAAIIDATTWLQQAFRRVIRFPNGLEITIPIEFEIGYNLGKMKKCDVLDAPGLRDFYQTLPRPASHQRSSTNGQQLAASQVSSSATSGFNTVNESCSQICT